VNERARRIAIGGGILAVLLIVLGVGVHQATSLGYLPLIQGGPCYIGVYDTKVTMQIQPSIGNTIDCGKAVREGNKAFQDDSFALYTSGPPPAGTTLACDYKLEKGEIKVWDGGGEGLFGALLGPIACEAVKKNGGSLVTS
jgi:hypothetical protein